MAIDLNAVRGAGSPVYVDVTGQIGLTTNRATFESAVAAGLRAAGLPAVNLTITYPVMFSTRVLVRAVVRTTAQIVTAGQAGYLVGAVVGAASGFSADAWNVTDVGAPGATVKTDHPIGFLDAIGDTVTTALHWIIVLVAIGVVAWLVISSGLLSRGLAIARA
jgi:hypothetical protein